MGEGVIYVREDKDEGRAYTTFSEQGPIAISVYV